MILKVLKYNDFDFDKLPDDLYDAYDFLQKQTNGTLESNSEKLNILDETTFRSIKYLFPDDIAVIITDEIVEETDSQIVNDGFNTILPDYDYAYEIIDENFNDIESIEKQVLAKNGLAINRQKMENTKKAAEGLLVGNSHADGGIKIQTPEGQIEAEGGEVIINKRILASDEKYVCEGTPKEMTSKINEMEGGVSWSAGGTCRIVKKAENGTEISEDISRGDNGVAVQFILKGKLHIISADTDDQAELIQDAIDDYKEGFIKKAEFENTLQSYMGDEEEINPGAIEVVDGIKHAYSDYYKGWIPLRNQEPINLDTKAGDGTTISRKDVVFENTGNGAWNFKYSSNGVEATGLIKKNTSTGELDYVIEESNSKNDNEIYRVLEAEFKEYERRFSRTGVNKAKWGSKITKPKGNFEKGVLEDKINSIEAQWQDLRTEYRNGHFTNDEYVAEKKALVELHRGEIERAVDYGINVPSALLYMPYSTPITPIKKMAERVQQHQATQQRAERGAQVVVDDKKVYRITSTNPAYPEWTGKVDEIKDFVNQAAEDDIIFDFDEEDSWKVNLEKMGLNYSEYMDEEAANGRTIMRPQDASVRPSPSVSATAYPVGYKLEGNDGHMWEITADKNGVHRWKKIKYDAAANGIETKAANGFSMMNSRLRDVFDYKQVVAEEIDANQDGDDKKQLWAFFPRDTDKYQLEFMVTYFGQRDDDGDGYGFYPEMVEDVRFTDGSNTDIDTDVIGESVVARYVKIIQGLFDKYIKYQEWQDRTKRIMFDEKDFITDEKAADGLDVDGGYSSKRELNRDYKRIIQNTGKNIFELEPGSLIGKMVKLKVPKGYNFDIKEDVEFKTKVSAEYANMIKGSGKYAKLYNKDFIVEIYADGGETAADGKLVSSSSCGCSHAANGTIIGETTYYTRAELEEMLGENYKWNNDIEWENIIEETGFKYGFPTTAANGPAMWYHPEGYAANGKVLGPKQPTNTFKYKPNPSNEWVVEYYVEGSFITNREVRLSPFTNISQYYKRYPEAHPEMIIVSVKDEDGDDANFKEQDIDEAAWKDYESKLKGRSAANGTEIGSDWKVGDFVDESVLNGKYEHNWQLFSRRPSYVLQYANRYDGVKYRVIAVLDTPSDAIRKREDLEKGEYHNLKIHWAPFPPYRFGRTREIAKNGIELEEGIEIDNEGEQAEFDAIHSYLQKTTEHFDDWDWDGKTLNVYLEGEKVASYNRAMLVELGVLNGHAEEMGDGGGIDKIGEMATLQRSGSFKDKLKFAKENPEVFLENGGPIDSVISFTEDDFKRLNLRLQLPYEFNSRWSGYVFEIYQKGGSKILGKYNPKKNTLFIVGNNASNPLVQWLRDNDYVSTSTRVLAANGYAANGYVGKGELVWRKLSSSEKMKFLYENFTPEITPRGQEILVGKVYNFLPKNVKIKLNEKYANVEEYDKGGPIHGSFNYGEGMPKGSGGWNVEYYMDDEIPVIVSVTDNRTGETTQDLSGFTQDTIDKMEMEALRNSFESQIDAAQYNRETAADGKSLSTMSDAELMAELAKRKSIQKAKETLARYSSERQPGQKDYLDRAEESIEYLNDFMKGRSITIGTTMLTYVSHTKHNMRVMGGRGSLYNVVPYFPKTSSPELDGAYFYTLVRGKQTNNFAVKNGSVIDIADDGMNILK